MWTLQTVPVLEVVGWAAGRASGCKRLIGYLMAWLSVWSKVQMICIWSSWCHCHPIISCSSKMQNGLRLLCRLTQVVLEKRPLNGCSSSGDGGGSSSRVVRPQEWLHRLYDWTVSSEHLVFVCSFFIILFCLVLCGRLSWLIVSFWAHVNVVYRVVVVVVVMRVCWVF